MRGQSRARNRVTWMRIHSVLLALMTLAGLQSCEPGVTGGTDLTYGVTTQCDSCRISATVIWRSAPRNENIVATRRAVRTSTGILIVTEEDGLALFDDQGRTKRLVGRHGRGPQEFFDIKDVIRLRNDSIVVIHSDRMTLLDPSLAFVSSVRLPFAVRARGVAMIGDSLLALPARARGASGIDHAIQVVTRDGRRVTAVDPIVDRRAATFVSGGEAGSIWSLPIHSAPRFQAIRFDPKGARAPDTLSHLPPWFLNRRAPRRGQEEVTKVTHPDPAQVIDLHEDPDGLLWLLTRVPDERWGESAAGRGYQIRFDSIIEVFSEDRGLLAGMRMDEALTGFTQAGHAVAYSEDAAGFPELAIVALSLSAGS